MIFSFHHEAEIEFNKAIDYYEQCERGLGYDFSIEVFNRIRTLLTTQLLGRLSKKMFGAVL